MNPIHSLEPLESLEPFHIPDPVLDVVTHGENCVRGGLGDGDLRGKHQGLPPVQDLEVGLPGSLTAEGRIANQHLIHDDPQ